MFIFDDIEPTRDIIFKKFSIDQTYPHLCLE